jgi:hypothetical protein
MEKDTKIPLEPKLAERVKDLSTELRTTAKDLKKASRRLDALKEKCECIHGRLWKTVDECPGVDVDANSYSYCHEHDELTYTGSKDDDDDVPEIIKRVLGDLFKGIGGDVKMGVAKISKTDDKESGKTIEQGNDTQH